MFFKKSILFFLVAFLFACNNNTHTDASVKDAGTTVVNSELSEEIEVDENGHPIDTVTAKDPAYNPYEGFNAENPAPAVIVDGKVNDQNILSLSETPKEGVGYRFDLNGFDISKGQVLNQGFRKFFGNTTLNTLDRNVTIIFSSPITNESVSLDKVNGYLSKQSKLLNEFLKKGK